MEFFDMEQWIEDMSSFARVTEEDVDPQLTPGTLYKITVKSTPGEFLKGMFVKSVKHTVYYKFTIASKKEGKLDSVICNLFLDGEEMYSLLHSSVEYVYTEMTEDDE